MISTCFQQIITTNIQQALSSRYDAVLNIHTVSYEPIYFLEVDFDQNDAPEWTTLPDRRNKMLSETVESNKIGCVIFE